MILMDEKRENPRLHISLGSSIRSEEEDRRAFSIVRNVSSTGIYLTTKKQYTEGSTTDCIVSIDDDMICFKGEIVRTCDHNPYFGYGIEITEIDDKDGYKLDKFIEESMSLMNGYESHNTESEHSGEDLLSYDSGIYPGSIGDADIGIIGTEGEDGRMIQANFPFNATLEEFDLTNQLPEVNNHIEDILTLRWLEEAKNILIFGPSGAGKTHIAVGIGMKAIENGYKVSYTTMNELLDFIKNQNVDPICKYMLNKIMNSRVVIIDEAALTPLSSEDTNGFFQLVSKLYGKASLIITSDLTFEQLENSIGDSATVKLIQDRLVHNISLRALVN